MEMSILEIEYKNIRRIKDLKLSFVNSEGKVINNSFIMMANGTGKTTTMKLIKGLFDGSASKWDVDEIKAFSPINQISDNGEFNITVRFDGRPYKYFLLMDYKVGKAIIETKVQPKGREQGLKLPETLKGIFTEEFVRRFVFDGEQAEKAMDSHSNEAEEAIKYLYRLNELDNIITHNQNILLEIQESEGSKGTNESLRNLRTRKENVASIIKKLEERAKKYRKNIAKLEREQKEKIEQQNNLNKKNEALDEERQEIFEEQLKNKKSVETKISDIVHLIKLPYLIHQEFYNRMSNLGSSMTKLKLPKTISCDFFVELAEADNCICGRGIGEKEKKYILINAEKYLGSDQQSVLNAVKSCLVNNSDPDDARLSNSFNELSELREQANRIQTRLISNEEKLLEAGGEKAIELKEKIEELGKEIAVLNSRLETIESRDEINEELTEENNLYKAQQKYKEYERKLASATRTNGALKKKELIESLIQSIKEQATSELKREIIRKTNERIKKVILDDFIEVENIDHYIKLKGKEGASEGQTLGIAYCFLGTLFEDAELKFPFVIDSPTGKMDFDKRQAVADIIPQVFNQMIAFVQSAEVKHFADRFYDNPDAQFLTIVVSSHDDSIEVKEGSEFFNSYQDERKGDK